MVEKQVIEKPTRLMFMDTETTGLNRACHEAWEIAYVVADHYPQNGLQVVQEHTWLIQPQRPQYADPMSLKINDFYRRTADGPKTPSLWHDRDTVAHQIALHSIDTHLVGAVPDFDQHFVTAFLLSEGYHPGWHYHIIDIETLIAGRFGLVPPYKSEDLFGKVGLPRDYPGKHTAMGDTKQLIACWNALYFNTPILEPAQGATS